jgi:hypothetical protein
MQLRDRFPVSAVIGCDFVSRSSELGPGERVVDLDVDLDTLPAWGILCISEATVRNMMALLGFDYDPDLAANLKACRAENAALKRTLAGYRKAFDAIDEVVKAS